MGCGGGLVWGGGARRGAAFCGAVWHVAVQWHVVRSNARARDAARRGLGWGWQTARLITVQQVMCPVFVLYFPFSLTLDGAAAPIATYLFISFDTSHTVVVMPHVQSPLLREH